MNRKAVKQTVEATLGERRVSGQAEVSISIVGDRKMRSLNKKYRQKDKTTDVLSFSQADTSVPIKSGPVGGRGEWVSAPDGVLRLGDVIVSFPQARKNAREKETLVDEEINFLIRHGLLHLLGIHHEE